MYFQINANKPVISNVVCTADLHQSVNLKEFLNFGWGVYDSAIYGGRCGYVKLVEMKGKATIFPSGKMISLGAKSVKKSIQQLNLAKFYLVEAGLISDIKLEPKIQNVVATLTLDRGIKMNKAVISLDGSTYEPERFPAIIYKILTASYLIFESGKIVITGAKSEEAVLQAAFEIQQKLARSLS